MDIHQLDIELNAKIIEALRDVLRTKGVQIFFETPKGDMLEASNVNYKEHKFRLFKKMSENTAYELNRRYLPLISKKLIESVKDMSNKEASLTVKRKTWYLSVLTPFLGRRIRKKKEKETLYRVNYNNIIIELSKYEYDKLNYYTKYVYKIQQLEKLNRILGIQQTFTIVFDDDKIAKEMFRSMYDNLSDIIKPPDHPGGL